MDIEFLRKHKFQFIGFFDVYYPEKGDTGNVQLNNDSHILHICKGQLTVCVDDQSFIVKTGDVVAIPSFRAYTMIRTDDFEMMNIHYKMWLDNGTLLDDIKRLPLFFTPSYFNWCHKKLLEIKNIIHQQQSLKSPDVLAHEIVLRHFAENPLTDISGFVSDSRIQKIQKILEDPGLIKFNSNALADLCRLSKSQMNRKFKLEFGISPQKYWEKQRITHICTVLKKSSVSINEISDRWGFGNSGYFCNWFKRKTNLTPSQYRKNYFINNKNK